MFDNRVIAELKKVIGWANDPTGEIPTLSTSLTDTESGQTYQGFKPDLVRLDYIQALLRANYPIEDYLDTIETEAINTLLNRLVVDKKLNADGKDLATNNLIYVNQVRGQTVVNESRFVGIEFSFKDTLGIRAVINRIGLYFTQPQTNLTLYLYNSLQDDVISTYTFNSSNPNSFTWITERIVLDIDDSSGTSGGVWYLGYYQDDITGNAIQYKNLNWINGYCGSCNKNYARMYKSISKYVKMCPFYVANGAYTVGKVPDPNNIVYQSTNNYGFNLNVSIKCNLTQFWIDNRLTMTDAIGKMVAKSILEMYVGSSQVSATEQNVQNLALRALEGANDTKAIPFSKTVEDAIKAVNLDQSNVNEHPCLPCARKGSSIGAL